MRNHSFPSMSRLRAAGAGWVAAIGFCASGATPVAIPPGDYDLTIETVLPHLEEALRYATTRTRQCLREPDATGMFPLLQHQAFTGCVLVPKGEAGDGLRFVLACRNREAASGTALFDVDAGSVAAALDIKMGAKNMTVSQRIHGRRVGDCGSPGFPPPRE